MIERATWRLRPDDPKTPLGWMFEVDCYRGVPLYPVLAGSVVLMALLSKACMAWLPLGIGEAASSILSMFPVFLLVAALRQDRREALAPDPALGRVHAGSVRVALGERESGADRGVVAFSDGWLLYEGVQTSFALSRGDVGRSRRIGDERHLELTSGHRLAGPWCGRRPDWTVAALDSDPALAFGSVCPRRALRPSRSANLTACSRF